MTPIYSRLLAPLRCSSSALLALLALAAPLHADPLPDDAYVDLIVVPVGPVPLATFERADPAAATAAATAPTAAAPGKPGSPAPPPAASGGGVRVKDVSLAEIPPRAVFVKKTSGKYYQVSCFLNAVGIPVRVPVHDSDLTLYVRSVEGGDAFTELGKFKLTQPNPRLLVLLTKKREEKKWTQPTLTVIPVPMAGPPAILFINGSESVGCGISVDGKVLALAALKHRLWQAAADAPPPEVMLAMADNEGQSLPPFFNNSLPLEADTSRIIISYDVTPQESFRGGKYAMGEVSPAAFQPAQPYPPEPPSRRK
ncbi:MAG: hypothetical protein WCK77_04915 [Verrucomicrobiota bacterium]